MRMLNFTESSTGAIDEVVQLVLKATTDSSENAALEPTRITELICAISTHPFEAFVTCHKHLHETINCQLEDKTKTVPKVAARQLKMCLHERDQNAHSCFQKILVSYFQIYKSTREEPVSIDNELLPKVFEFVTSFTCISQIANLLDLFNLSAFDRQALVPYAKQMIDQSCLIQASIVINRLDIRQHFDSNSLLLELLYEDNLLDIEGYLQLNSLQLDQSIVSSLLKCDSITDENDQTRKCHSLFLQFMRYLDEIHAGSDHSNVPVFERLRPIPKKQFLKKIYRFVFDLFKRPIFSRLDDATLHLICPNITMCFYNKQLAGLFFRFKEETVPMSPNVITDHINALANLAIGTQLTPNAHEYVLSMYAKRNDFASASEYIRMHNLTSNLFTSTATNNVFINPTVLQSYSTELSLDNGIHMVQTEKQFNECLEQIQKWDFVSLDSEWFTNFFVLRSNTVVSLIQIAHDNISYLIDCVTLAESKPLHFYLGQFITKVINNQSILKIGYSVQNDFDVFWKSYLYSASQVKEIVPEITLSPKNILDFREFFFYLINSPNNYRDLFDPTRLSIASQLSGISQVTYVLTGFSIDKTEQLSDWSKRPLRDSQIIYSAIDAYCLVECYRQMERLFSTIKNISIVPFITDVFRKQTNTCDGNNYSLNSGKQKQKQVVPDATESPATEVEPAPINQFRCVVDDMLFGIIRYLRICNADAVMADPKNREKSVLMALKEGRIFITSGQVYERYRKYFVSPSDCIKLSNNGTALEQFKELANKCRLIIRLEDLFARCSLCNTTPFIIISQKEFKSHHERFLEQVNEAEQSAVTDGEKKLEPFMVPANGDRNTYRIDFESFGKMKFINKMPQVDKFYICSNVGCGHIYWDGCHSSNFIHSIKSLIVDA